MTKRGLPLETRLLNRVERDPSSDCWLWTGCGLKSGYGSINVGGRMELAHRVSFRLFCDTIPDGQFVCHRCDRPACVNPDHLFLGTPADNSQDMARKGRAGVRPRRGAQNGRAKLAEADVIAIRARLAAQEPTAKIAAAFGVTSNLVGKIKHREVWGWL